MLYTFDESMWKNVIYIDPVYYCHSIVHKYKKISQE